MSAACLTRSTLSEEIKAIARSSHPECAHDQADQGRRERSVLCTQATEDADMRRSCAPSEPGLFRDGELGALGDEEAVGHPGDVISHALAVARTRVAARDLAGVREVMVEEAPHGVLDAHVLAAGLGAEVDAVEHELAQAQHGPADLAPLRDLLGAGGVV